MSGQQYSYVCGKGHGVSSPKELTKCPVYVRGKPCSGALKRIGQGSRTASPPRG